jgi:hypothetical protein
MPMPEVSQYTFALREVAEALLKHSGIKEGKWVIGVNFTLNIGNIGANPEEVRPTLMAAVDAINIGKADANTEAVGLIVDASKLR